MVQIPSWSRFQSLSYRFLKFFSFSRSYVILNSRTLTRLQQLNSWIFSAFFGICFCAVPKLVSRQNQFKVKRGRGKREKPQNFAIFFPLHCSSKLFFLLDIVYLVHYEYMWFFKKNSEGSCNWNWSKLRGIARYLLWIAPNPRNPRSLAVWN